MTKKIQILVYGFLTPKNFLKKNRLARTRKQYWRYCILLFLLGGAFCALLMGRRVARHTRYPTFSYSLSHLFILAIPPFHTRYITFPYSLYHLGLVDFFLILTDKQMVKSIYTLTKQSKRFSIPAISLLRFQRGILTTKVGQRVYFLNYDFYCFKS